MTRFAQFWSIYEDSFPQEERRDPRDYLENLSRDPHYRFTPHIKDGSMIGFVIFWDLEAFLFVEHLAIDHKARGNGYGTRILRKLMSPVSPLTPGIVLEVEPPEDVVTRRRIRFYRRMGFHLNNYEYVQPPYREGETPVPLKLMSYPVPLHPEIFKGVTKKIYHRVYHIKSGHSPVPEDQEAPKQREAKKLKNM